MKDAFRVALVVMAAVLVGCPARPRGPASVPPAVLVSSGELVLALDDQLRPTLWRKVDGARTRLSPDASSPPLFDAVVGSMSGGFVVDRKGVAQRALASAFGKGRRTELMARRGALSMRVWIDRYPRYPGTVFVSARLKNVGAAPLTIARWRQSWVALRPATRWAFQGAALEWGKGYVFPLSRAQASDNFLGAAGPGKTAGGGVPVDDVWSRAAGVAVGHSSVLAQPSAYAPLSRDARGGVAMGLEQRALALAPGAELSSLPGFVQVHGGDFYRAVSTYRRMLADQGHGPAKSPPSAYDAIWCSWGYEFNAQVDEITGVIFKLKALGLRWIVVDDRWFERYGDWTPRPAIYGKRGQGLKLLVRTAHEAGLKIKLWWIPLAAEAKGARYASHVYADSDVVKRHPEWLILDKDGKIARGVRDLAILCPAVPDVHAYIKRLTERFIKRWGFDGHKLDVVFTVPPCHNPAHHHKSPDDAPRAVADIMREIFVTTEKLKPDAVTEICPCGTTPNHAWLPYMNQAVTADPVGSAQVRRRVKLLKALLGARFAVYGDHVELTRVKDKKEVGRDFASSIGTGAVIGTKFTWPEPKRALPDQGRTTMFLDPKKERVWARWIKVFNEQGLASGRYRGELYDIGFDRPEVHVVEKGGVLHYGIYAAGSFKGDVELRGLAPGRYRIVDYVAHEPLGEVEVKAGAAPPRLSVGFERHLLIEARRY